MRLFIWLLIFSLSAHAMEQLNDWVLLAPEKKEIPSLDEIVKQVFNFKSDQKSKILEEFKLKLSRAQDLYAKAHDKEAVAQHKTQMAAMVYAQWLEIQNYICHQKE